jgi:hypothetical protein
MPSLLRPLSGKKEGPLRNAAAPLFLVKIKDRPRNNRSGHDACFAVIAGRVPNRVTYAAGDGRTGPARMMAVRPLRQFEHSIRRGCQAQRAHSAR